MIIVVYIAVIIYFVLCLLSTEILYLGRNTRMGLIDNQGKKVYNNLEENRDLIKCSKINYNKADCLHDTYYSEIYYQKLKKKYKSITNSK